MKNKQGPRKPGHTQKQGNFRIPPGLLARLKVRAIHERTSMRAIVEGLVEGYLKGDFELEEQKNGPEKGE